MSSTTTTPATLKDLLDKADPNLLADLLRMVKLGTMLTPLKRAFAGLAAAAAFDLTAIDGTGETAGSGNANRLAARLCGTLRVTASATGASLGTYIVGDAAATPIVPPGGAGAAVGIATLSDDGKTITFPNTVTGFIIEYFPRSAADMASVVENG